jgi:outer membrane protein OmpA-like peptidoglycan-associated protein
VNAAGHCWKSGDWSPDKAVSPCDPVARAAELFEFNKATLLPAGQQKLDDVAKNAQGAKVEQVRIVGHADRIGSDQYNQELSERRAQAVKDYFAQKGADAQRIDAQGKGESEPVTGSQCDKLGKKANAKLISCLQPDRRVEIELLGSREVAGGASPASAGAGASTTPSNTSGSGSATINK